MRIDRPLESYIHYGIGPHACLGMDASRVALTAMLKVIGGLKNLRRAPGPQGQLMKIPREGGFYIYMTESHGSYFPFPTSKLYPWTCTCTLLMMGTTYSDEGELGWRLAPNEEALKQLFKALILLRCVRLLGHSDVVIAHVASVLQQPSIAEMYIF